MKSVRVILLLLTTCVWLWYDIPETQASTYNPQQTETCFCLPDGALPPAQLSRTTPCSIVCPTLKIEQSSHFSIYGHNALSLFRQHVTYCLQAAEAIVPALPASSIAFPFVVFQ